MGYLQIATETAAAATTTDDDDDDDDDHDDDDPKIKYPRANSWFNLRTTKIVRASDDKKSSKNKIPKPASGHLSRNQNDQRSTKTKS